MAKYNWFCTTKIFILEETLQENIAFGLKITEKSEDF